MLSSVITGSQQVSQTDNNVESQFGVTVRVEQAGSFQAVARWDAETVACADQGFKLDELLETFLLYEDQGDPNANLHLVTNFIGQLWDSQKGWSKKTRVGCNSYGELFGGGGSKRGPQRGLWVSHTLQRASIRP